MIIRKIKRFLLIIIGLCIVYYILAQTILPKWTNENYQTQEEKDILDAIPRQALHNLLENMLTYTVVNDNSTFSKGENKKFDQSSKIINSSPVSLNYSQKLDKKIIEDGQCSLLELDKCTDHQLQEMLETKMEIDAPTPPGFIEVRKKIKTMRKFRKNHMTYDETKRRFPDNDPRSRKMLAKRSNSAPANSTLRRFVDIQKKRTRLIQTICDDLVKNGTNLPSATFLNIIVDRPDYITFCPIYKAASTSWSVLLLKMRGFEKKTVIKNIQKVISLTFEKVSNTVAPWMSKGTTRFLIVRHPFQRLISCYRDKFEGAKRDFYYIKYGEKMVKSFRPKPKDVTSEEQQYMLNAVKNHIDKKMYLDFEGNFYASPMGPTFEEFIKFIVIIKNDDEHWAPFYKHCALCHMVYDVVLKFETLEADSSSFLEYLNHTEIKADKWENPTSDGVTTKDVVCKYFSAIDSKLLTKLVKKYSFDFIFFDYSPKEYFKCTKEYASSNL